MGGAQLTVGGAVFTVGGAAFTVGGAAFTEEEQHRTYMDLMGPNYKRNHPGLTK